MAVATFDPDATFTPDVLSRLEAVMGVEIESVLATKCFKFLSASGVPAQFHDTTRNVISPLIIVRTHSFEYIQDAIHKWSMGYSSRPSTWRELLQVIQDMGFLELREQIETFMKGEASYLEAYYHFITTKESLDLLFLKFLFVGPPRLGKTTLRRRLLKEIVDLISAGEADKSQPSTGAVESSDVVVTGVSSTTAVITESDESEWSRLAGLVDEARMLVHSLISSIRNTHSSSASSQVDDVPRHDQSSELESTSFKSLLSSSKVTGLTQQNQVPVLIQTSVASNSSQEVKVKQNIPEALTILRQAMGSDHWKNIKHMFKAYIRMEDTGGQPELMDMLPALTLGPGLYLLFINLQNDLNHHYKLTYCNASGESTLPVESVYSVKEMLLSSLSCISCSNASSASSHKPISYSSFMNNTLESSKAIAYIVGTHKDKVSSEHVKKLNEDLKKMIMPTEFYKNDIIQYASEEDLIITIDNMAGGPEEVERVKTLLEKSMTRHFKKLKIPAVWLFFSLFLRHHDKRTASLDYCIKLSSTLGMSARETEVALWFLHHHAGVLMYFPNVPELKDLVIIDVQVVYDSVTVLILQAMSYEKVGHSAANNFKKTGKFTLSHIISATRDISGDHISIDKLVALIEFLHIIARISTDDQAPSSLSHSKEEITYMMPCILKIATTEELHSISKKLHGVPPLLYHFISGAVPIGFFSALMACLITTKSFKLIQDGVFKNLIKFRYGQCRTSIVFICHSNFYELSVSTSTKNIQLHNEYDSIRKTVESTFVKVASRFNYGSFVNYQLAFDCPIHPDCNRQHLCVIDRDEDFPQMMDCLDNVDDPTPVELSECQQIWFGQMCTKNVPQAHQVKTSSEISPREDTPTLFSLIAFHCSDGKTINILNEIGMNYYDFGIILLNDGRGNEIERLVHKHLKDSLPILRDIFKLWLDGKGQPVSWQTLINVLKDVGLIALAKTVQSQKL